MLHQAALAARAVVGVQDTLAHGHIDCVDSGAGSGNGRFFVASGDLSTRFLDLSTSTADEDTIASVFARRSANTLECRLMISQRSSPPGSSIGILPDRNGGVQRRP